MDKLALDLQAWLKFEALLTRALNRYDEQAEIDTGDGARCAGQLCAILLQVDSAPKGRQWYAGIDLFTPGHRNLVWRMLILNNAAISAELQSALAHISAPLPPGGLEVSDAEQKARYKKACAIVLAALTQLNKTLSATDKINSGTPKVMDSGLKRFDRLRAAGELAKVIYDSPHAVLGAATMARFKALPATQGETLIAKAPVMLMARGLGQHAVALTKKMQADSLSNGLPEPTEYELLRKGFRTPGQHIEETVLGPSRALDRLDGRAAEGESSAQTGVAFMAGALWAPLHCLAERLCT